MKIEEQMAVLATMSNDMMLCMWRKMLAKKDDKEPRDLTIQNALRDELVRRNVIRFDGVRGQYVLVGK